MYLWYYPFMVRLINKNNVKYIGSFLFRILKLQEVVTHIKNVNSPKLENAIYVMWHANQFLVHGLPDREKVNVLISNSLDGDIVADVCAKWGFKVLRGSAGKKGAVSSTLKMLDVIKNGESVAIMVDGPRGPYHEVKKGAVTLAKESGIPIVPVHWYSDEFTFRSFPSWDKIKCPLGICRIINIYAEPIYANDKTDEEIANEIKEALLNLEKIAPQKFKEAKKQKLWG